LNRRGRRAGADAGVQGARAAGVPRARAAAGRAGGLVEDGRERLSEAEAGALREPGGGRAAAEAAAQRAGNGGGAEDPEQPGGPAADGADAGQDRAREPGRRRERRGRPLEQSGQDEGRVLMQAHEIEEQRLRHQKLEAANAELQGLVSELNYLREQLRAQQRESESARTKLYDTQ